MTSLLEMLITFVGVMLILALIAQSVQELIKATFAVKGFTARHALEKLITEAARAQGLMQADGQEIAQAVTQRLIQLGQDGVRRGALRLDTLSAPLLGQLITSIEPEAVGSLRGIGGDQAERRLGGVAAQAVAWFPLAMDPVDERYRRRMRGFALLSSALVVLALNADALAILRRARDDPQFRQRVQATAASLDSLSQRARAEATRDTVAGTPQHVVQDSARSALTRVVSPANTDLVLGTPKDWQYADYRWWIGILASILLVSLGAPFWHDAFEALFGLKNRIRAEAEAGGRARNKAEPDAALH
jgi:hypothetical protein